MVKRTMHDIHICARHFSHTCLSKEVLDVSATSHAHPRRRMVRLGRLLASWRSPLSLSRSGVAWSTSGQTRGTPVNRVARVHAPAGPDVHFVTEPGTVEHSRALCEPLSHLHTPALVLWGQLVTNLHPVWVEKQVFAQDRV